jgi:hypothetical protein
MSMDNVEVIRMRCPTCERRLEVPTNAKFVACARCGSEYEINKRGGTITLIPYIDQVQELNEQIAHAEQQQAGGCANLTFMSVGLGAFVFIIFGGFGLLFNQPALGCILGWIIAMVIVFLGFAFAGRYVNADQARLNMLQRAREQAATVDGETEEPQGSNPILPTDEAREGTA